MYTFPLSNRADALKLLTTFSATEASLPPVTCSVVFSKVLLFRDLLDTNQRSRDTNLKDLTTVLPLFSERIQL